jgi:2-oxoglutarate ferredoxin oxidoreductase subunit alpha
MSKRTLHIVIGGEAGQGLVTIGQILAKGLVRSGFSIVVTQSYQSRIRGGHNTYSIRAGCEDLFAPQETIDLLVALDAQSVTIHQQELSAEALAVVDSNWELMAPPFLAVPFKELVADRYANIFALGVAGSLLGLSESLLELVLEEFFGHKDPVMNEANRQALKTAYQWTIEQPISFPKLEPLSNPQTRLMINGNEAIALGALSAGMKFLSFYPMTPATSISLTLAAQAEKMGLIVEQAEDEISAINMAIGASYAGAPSMVSTSGGGFALMVEGVSLAGMTETPLVIIVAQRPGPATGLPTRTEQGDLEFILHAGHGEFPRAVFTPGTVEECFYLIRRAFEMAESVQGPIFLLTDQFLADSYRAVIPFDLSGLPIVSPIKNSFDPVVPYQRYVLTENGLSPRLLPGRTEHLVVADSDEHTEDGHLTENLVVRKQMVEKRLAKMKILIDQVVPPEYSGDPKGDLLLVTWGSSKGSVLEAADKLRRGEKRVGVLHFSQVWPLVPEHILPRLEEAQEVVCIEGNAFGQLARLIRRETGFLISKRILRYDGLPITPEYILTQLD